jgi:RNA polymerase sigma-70 factor (ECF subfamily)
MVMSQFQSMANTDDRFMEDRWEVLTPLTFVGDDAALMQALRAGHPGAAAAFYDQHAAHVHRTLRAVLGADEEIPDLLQEVFIRALDRIGKLRDIERVRGWLTTIAVFVARGHLRLRSRRTLLRVFSPEHTRPSHLDQPSSEARIALREVYAVLDELALDERVAFVLRIIDGMALAEAAEACKVSLATFKRRLSRAEKHFVEAARERPTLAHWLEEGSRWHTEKTS